MQLPGEITARYLPIERPRVLTGAIPYIVCLCGSTRFYKQFREANLAYTLDGCIVLSIGCDTKADGDIPFGEDIELIKEGLDYLHKRKIDLADYVYVLNVGGYIGDSTRSEIMYAASIGKPIGYLESCRG